ncbi:MAG: hypothetical protein HKN95_01130 [Acidimicrobiia bacterium]|nr:hypothetical protein [Acidimicrobiia bacterium]
MRRSLSLVFLLLVAACSDLSPSAGSPISADVPAGDEALVVHVSDGDSLIVEIDGTERRVRLIGINAPETDECFGEESSERLESLLLDRQVTLVADLEPEDQYGRLLRYVFLDGSLINEELAAGGYAMARSYEPNTARQSALRAAEEEARTAELGLWAKSACAAESDLTIDHVEADAPGPDDENLNGEWIRIKNDGDDPQTLDGWSIRDAESVNRFEFPDGIRLEAGDDLTVFTGCGDATASGIFWCSPGPVWNNRGDVAFLLDPGGKIADRFDY